MEDSGIARLETDADGQLLHLPEAFRLPGSEVRLRRVGRGVLIEPVERDENSKAIFSLIDQIGGADFLTEGRPEQPAMPLAKAVFDE